MSKSSKKSAVSASRRSAIARKAAHAAWKTMQSKAYIRATAKGRKAVESYLSNR